jgi:enterochelin esterase family protein
MAHRRGTTTVERIDSAALAGNPLGDPTERDVHVYLPPGYRGGGARRWPVVLVLTGFTGFGEMMFRRQSFGEALPQRLDRLIATGKIPPMIFASPDCFTAYGGSQYVDSPAVGNYETFVVREVVPRIDAAFRTRATPRHRAVAGKSSGGYGALMLGMKHPDVFGALASHSGDAYFDYCYGFDFVKAWVPLMKAGGVEKWLKAFRAAQKVKMDDVHVLNIVAMSACYLPNPKAPLGFDLPFDMETGEERHDLTRKWAKFDPVVACGKYAGNLRKLRGVFVDCGLRDEYALQAGARILVKRLRALRVKPLVHQEFEDGHMDITYRYDVSLPWLGKWIG